MAATPDEMAQAFASAHSRHLVDGLFLSSGIAGNPQTTMTQMLDTATILRTRYRYRGYLHLKVMPGAPSDTIAAAAQLADRISLNIESPTEEDLAALSPDKDLKKGFFYTLTLIKDQIKKLHQLGQKAPSVTTQFVVGAGEEKDSNIIKTTYLLYKAFNLKRVFYSAFRPVPQTPLADHPAASLTREHRLYQADFLLRFYRFTPNDIPLDNQGNLLQTTDPKLAWAQLHPEYFPINLNQAGYWQLLKVPGIGPESAQKIINLRKHRPIKSLSQLEGQRIQTKKASSFVGTC